MSTLSKVPREVLGRLDSIEWIVDLFVYLSEDNMTVSVERIVESKFVGPEFLGRLIRCIEAVCLVRPRQIDLCARFVKQLFDAARPDNNLGSLLTVVSKELHHFFWNSQFDNIYAFLLYFIMRLVDLGLYTMDEVIHEIFALSVPCKWQYSNHLAVLSVYFGPELEVMNRELLTRLKKTVEQSRRRGLLTSYICKIVENMDTFSADNWKLLREIRSNRWHGNNILKAMLFDDVALLQSTITNVNEIFENPAFSIYSLLENGEYPIIAVAAIFGAVDIINWLLASGAQWEPHAEMIANCAVIANSPAVISIFDQLGVSFEASLPPAVRCLASSVIEWIVNKYPESLTKQCSSGSTALTQAVTVGNATMMKICLERSIDLNAADGTGMIPIDAIGESGNLVFLDLFLTLDCVDKTIGNPLMMAAQTGQWESVDMLLRDGRINPNAKGGDGISALHLAVANSHLHTVKLLLNDSRVEVDTEVMRAAARQNRVDIVRELLPRVNDDSWKRWETETGSPLFVAIHHGMPDVFEFLFNESGINVNARDESTGITMLWLAVQCQQVDIMEILLKNEECVFDQSVILIAEQGRDPDVIALLEIYMSRRTNTVY